MCVFLIAVKEKSGGLALFWANGCSISFKHYSSNIIDVLITNPMGDWRCTFVYGEPKVELRHKLWDQLRFVRAQWSGPWVCAGDFNEGLSRDEHLSKGTKGEHQMKLFRDCLEVCELVDLGYSGPKYTWNNRQEGDNNVKVRLDRAVANGQFMQLFDYWQVENIITSSSDHYVILLSFGSQPFSNQKKLFSQNFRYEAMWARAADYIEVVEKIWNEDLDESRNLQAVWSNLNKMADSLRQWSIKTFGSVRKEIMKLRYTQDACE